MGALQACCRRSNTKEKFQSGTGITPSTEDRRNAAAEAATKRLRESETRGMDQDEYHRMNQRRIERERIEQQMKTQTQNSDGSGGLRMSCDVLASYRDCPLCLKLLFEPVSTLCGHTYCLLCLERFILSSTCILQCPICRENLNYLYSNSTHLKANSILHNLFRQEYEKEYEIRRNETKNERENTIKKSLVIGNTHQLLSCDYNYTRHEWTLFIKFENDDPNDISQFIKRIKILLHPTFTPSQVILNKPPFQLTRIGW